MRVKHRFSFRMDKSTKKITDFIVKNNIKHKVANGLPLMSLDIYEDSDFWLDLQKMFKKKKVNSLISCVYSTEELLKASWLVIRAKSRAEFPQPEDSYKNITYDDSNYCTKCGSGLVQKESFMLNKTPKWGRKNFVMLNWIESELFVSDSVANKFQQMNIQGLEIKDVLNYKTKDSLDNIKQLKISNILAEGMLNKDSTISINKCKKCNTLKYLISGKEQLVFNREIFTDQPSIVKTKEVFGDGLVNLQMILISQELYQVIKKNKWDKDLIIDPVILT